MSCVSRRLAPVLLAAALVVLPATSLLAQPQEPEVGGWWGSLVTSILSRLGPFAEQAGPTIAATAEDGAPTSTASGWWDPNGEKNTSGPVPTTTSSEEGLMGWWDPNG